jgi:hypothetical protein
LQDHDYAVVLANPGQMDQYNAIKEAHDLTDAAFLRDSSGSGFQCSDETRGARP